MTELFPFSALVGQERLVEALLVNAAAPEVGGVLVRGERGTAKSTAVRALAPLLPPVTAALAETHAFAPGDLAPGGPVALDAPVEERPAPLVELPIGATVDRLVGALDLARALDGQRTFEPGLLARAHRGLLYVDEVNLLPDHLVDVLLDAAASGSCVVEREAVSARHDARFLLVGTMNPEEGELRPQLLDRFGLGVCVRGPDDPAVRAEIVRRRLAYERDPAAFAAAYAAADLALAERIAAARERLDGVRLGEQALGRIVRACATLGVDGVRGDIVCARAARALAALDGADEVDAEHVRRAALLALAHRRRDPLDGAAPDDSDVERALAGEDDPDPPDPPPGGGAPPQPAGASPNGGDPSHAPAAAAGEPRGEAPDLAAPARERVDDPVPAGLTLRDMALDRGQTGAGPAGRGARAAGPAAGAIDSRRAAPGAGDVAVVATLHERLAAAALAEPGAPPLREHVRAGREGQLLCLVVDASGSMGARRRMARVKGALLELLRDAYARRDRVAIVAFRDARAEVLHVPGTPLEHAAAVVRALPTGGRTPLAAGLEAAAALVRRERSRGEHARAIAVVLTDGRTLDADGRAARAAAGLGRTFDAVHVVDTEDGAVRLGLAGQLAAAARGRVHPLPAAPRPTRRAA